MSRPTRWGLIGAGVGFCVALLVVVLAYYASSHLAGRDFSIPYFILAPTSILAPPMSFILTATTRPIRWLLLLIFSASNGFYYAGVCYAIGKVRFRRWPSP